MPRRPATPQAAPVPPALEFARRSPLPLYHQLAERLRAELKAGRFAAGDRYYSDSALLAASGLSLLTVRQAVGVLVAEGLLARKHGSGSRVSAKGAALAHPAGPGLVLFAGWGLDALSGWDAIFFRDIYAGALRAAQARGCALLVDDPGERDVAAAVARAGGARVVGVVAVVGDGAAERASAFAALGLPVATVNLEVDGLPSVQPEEHAGAAALVGRLLALGHRRLVHLHSGERTPHWRAVRAAFTATIAAAGLAPVVVDSPLKAGGSLEAGHAAAALAMARTPRPTALVCGNDLMAVGALRWLHEHGVAVPGAVSVTGYDDILAAQVCTPPLTTVAVDRAGLGAHAVELLFASGPERRSRLLPTWVVERGSSGPAPG